MHGEVVLDGHRLFVSDEFTAGEGGSLVQPGSVGGRSTRITVEVDDADAVVDRAAAHGATVLMPVQDMFWGAATANSSTPTATNGASISKRTRPGDPQLNTATCNVVA